MRYDHLPGHVTPKITRSSPAKEVAGHIISQLKRPSRMRGRFIVAFVMLVGIWLVNLGTRHVDDIQRTASSLSSYVPSQMTSAFESTRWDDSQDPELKDQIVEVKDPSFYLLIPASKPTLKLCKTLLSAAILGYPPPTLLGYGQEGDRDRPGADVVRNALKFLDGKDPHEEDLVLVVDESSLFQLPAEVHISRFFHATRDSTYTLLEKHGRLPGNFTTLPSQCPQRYYTQVLFGAQKDCTSSPFSPACFFAPPSPLPKDPHDQYDQHDSDSRRATYMASSMLMGTVGHLRPLYKYANELSNTDMKSNGTQQIFSQIFGAQEYRRELYHQSTLGPITKASQWIASKLGVSKHQHHLLDHSSIPSIQNVSETPHCEFGIALDYTSSLFQILDSSSQNDVLFLKFTNLSESLDLPKKAMKKIHIPFDLNATAPPYGLPPPSNNRLTALDTLPQASSWSEVALATNVLIPESIIVPTTMNLSPQMNDSYQIWYQSHARALLRQYLRTPSTPINIVIPPPLPLKRRKSKALESSELTPREVSYTDLRGGHGGVWTDKGEWLEWNQVCGAFDAEVFGDGKGVFGHEGDAKGKVKAVYNGFGQLIAGQEIKEEVKKQEWEKKHRVEQGHESV